MAPPINAESRGVTAERSKMGMYSVSATFGFDVDAEWCGPNGAIEIPLDRNKQPLHWIVYRIEPPGDLLIASFHRT